MKINSSDLKNLMQSNQSQSNSGWYSLPGWARASIILTIVTVALILVIWGGKKLIKLIKDEGDEDGGGGASDKEDVVDNQKDCNKMKKDGVKETYGQGQYAAWATSLNQAFDGCGTSNGTWKTVFGQMKNDIDVCFLISTYGIRKYDGCNWEGDMGDKEGTLPRAIASELSASEIAEINDMFVKKNIKYRFA